MSGPGGDAPRYRGHHQAEQLELVGETADVGYHDELDLDALVESYEIFVLYRVPWNERVERLLAAARDRGRRVVADVDDLVFDKGKAHLLHEFSALGAAERREREEAIGRLGQTLAAVDGVVVSTDPLSAAAARLNPNVAVAYNAVSTDMVRAGEIGRRERRAPHEGEVAVAYLSGTATHDRDFLEAADAVVSALEQYPQMRFWAVGFLSLDERFDTFGERVVRVPYMPWRRLPSLIAQIDVNLAPLERDNAFTDAKSCLKYLEAAVVGVPTIATPTSDFRRAIEHDLNGLLASGPGDWRDAIGRLVESSDVRERLGKAALDDVLARHTTAARAAETAAAFVAAGAKC